MDLWVGYSDCLRVIKGYSALALEFIHYVKKNSQVKLLFEARLEMVLMRESSPG